ncbi:hypothetical protein Cgig2_023395 [Carnegiea gigantea]|uniref:Endonuclease/exonuclease/phosphatase domain-containing protein n=1 Tax=Carnegiea gigantea TaxID=171969 RepID=A0A9Q1GL22_9CARY|nr:hypothetical protein Cgig2_023395 [Carnegiea gigantea]
MARFWVKAYDVPETELLEEKRLFMDFKSNSAALMARIKLVFDNPSYIDGPGQERPSRMAIDSMNIIESPKVFKCKLANAQLNKDTLISDLKKHSSLPWLIGGDLNEVFYHSEKKEGPPKSQSTVDDFRSSFIDNSLYDLGYMGYDFTWSNFQENGIVVEERLECFYADTEWSPMFLNATVSHVDFDISDHLPVLLKCVPHNTINGARQKRFMFENKWLTEPSGRDTICAAWSSVSSSNAIENLLSRIEK